MKRLIICVTIACALCSCGHTDSELQEAYNQGKENGFNIGYSEGFEKGKEAGYKEGYNACLQQSIEND